MRPTRRHPSAPRHAGPPGCSQVTAVLCTLHWRERVRYHQGSTHGAALPAVTSTEALWRVAHAPPAALATSRWSQGQRRCLRLHARYQWYQLASGPVRSCCDHPRLKLGMRGVRGPILEPNLRLPYFSCTDVIDYLKICPIVPRASSTNASWTANVCDVVLVAYAPEL